MAVVTPVSGILVWDETTGLKNEIKLSVSNLIFKLLSHNLLFHVSHRHAFSWQISEDPLFFEAHIVSSLCPTALVEKSAGL